MQPTGFDILYEEGPCLVVNKPGGLLTQGPPGIDSLEVRVKDFLKTREGKSGNIYLGVPHRLDRPVSGAIVLARHVRAARRLCDQFHGRIVEKTYWAVVTGELSASEGTWRDYLRKLPDTARGEVVSAEHADAQQAILHYRVAGGTPLGTWLEIRLETGRFHQIRIQVAARGHAVLGDSLYGSTVPFGPATTDERQRWIALHARSLNFRHPMTRNRVEVTAPLPACWSDAGFAREQAAPMAMQPLPNPSS